MIKTRRFNIIVALVLALTMVMPASTAVYAADNEAYVYKYAQSVDYANNDVYYADGSGSTPAYLRYTSGPEGMQQYGGYCADFETTVDRNAYYSRTTLGESGHFSYSVTGHLRAILANSVPVKSYKTVASAAGVSGVSEGEVIAATQWAIWAYTNPSSPEIAIPSKNGKTKQEKVAYYLYNLPPISSGYATEPVLMNIDASQDGNRMIFDYSGSVNIGALYNKVITVTDGSGKALPYKDENYKVIVDVSGLNKDQKVNVKIEGKQTLAADAYFYNPAGGRGSSQSLISWFQGVTSVAGSASGTYDVDKEKTQLILAGDKKLTGRQIDTSVDDFRFVVKAAGTGDIAAAGTADADGKITFTPIEYTKAQAGKTFSYNVTETAGTNPGIEYDAAVKTVTVKVYYENGEVKTSVSYGDESGIAFTNRYTTKDADIQLNVIKKLEGKPLHEGQFQFTKVKCDVDGIPLDGAEIETVTNKADGSVVFGSETFTEPGEHYYLIREAGGGKRIDGITYDDLEVVVKVTVTDNKLGQLIAEAEYPADAAFENKYTADPVEVVFEGQKYLEGRPLADGEFTFVLKDEGGKELGKAVNDKDGDFVFGPLEFEKAGEYTYTISEINAAADGVTYDNAVHTVKVKVTDNDKGKLIAQVIYPEGGAVFHNTYKGQGQIEVTKIFKLNDAEKAADLKFEVGLFTDEGLTAKAVRADGTVVENKVIDMNQQASASVTFDGLEYGTYYVAEIGIDGMPLAEGEVTGLLGQTAYRQTVTYGQESVVLVIDNKTGSADITNDFYTEEYWKQGKIKVTKLVKTDGKDIGVNAKYFAALFADPELTQPASEVKVIEMAGRAEASVTFEKLEINRTYYAAETDMQGVPLKAGDYNISDITVENGAIEIVASDGTVVPEAVITNDYVTVDDKTQLKVIKKLEGKELQEGQFQFTKVECDENGIPLEGAAVETVTNSADGTVEFAEETYKEEGVHFYLIKEVNGGQRIDGITYDNLEVIVKVTVEYGEPGQLAAAVTYPEDITFENVYTEDAKGAIKVTKQVQIFGEVVRVDAKYFVALFADPELTQLASEVKAIEMNAQDTSSVVFEGLETNRTYYAAETDGLGQPLADGTYNITRITVIGGEVDLLPEMAEIPEVMIINEYDTDEFDYFDEDEDGVEEEEEEYYEEAVEDNDKEKTDKAVQTGDDFNAAIAVSAMAAALIAMLGAAVIRRRETEEK